MIDRDGATCDKCRTRESLEYIPFPAKIRHIKSKGWSVVPVGRIYKHYCPSCSRRPAKPKQTEYWYDKI